MCQVYTFLNHRQYICHWLALFSAIWLFQFMDTSIWLHTSILCKWRHSLETSSLVSIKVENGGLSLAVEVMQYYKTFKWRLFDTFLLFLFEFIAIFCWGLRPGNFNSVVLSSVFYTGFKTKRRNEFLFTAQPFVLSFAMETVKTVIVRYLSISTRL